MAKFNTYRLLCVAILLALCVALGCTQAFGQAQGSTGQITGSVRDNNGAAVAGAKVRAVNTQTGLEQTAISSDEGLFRLVLLPSGVYNLIAEASGFSKGEVKNVAVTVGQVIDANITLGVGPVTEAVTVT